MNISESSRVQRKGRVGRKSAGAIYYLYENKFYEKSCFDRSTPNDAWFLHVN